MVLVEIAVVGGDRYAVFLSEVRREHYVCISIT